MLIPRPGLTGATVRAGLAQLARDHAAAPGPDGDPLSILGGVVLAGVFLVMGGGFVLLGGTEGNAGPLLVGVAMLCLGAVLLRGTWGHSGFSRVVLRLRRFVAPPPDYEPGVDFIDDDLLAPTERDIARALDTHVETILAARLPEPYGDLLDHARNRTVLVDTRWRLALDLVALSEAADGLDAIPAEGPRASAAKARASRGVDERRARLRERVAVIADYAAEVRATTARIDDLDEAARIDRIARGLELDAADGGQSDEALASLAALTSAARAVAELHEQLSEA